MALSEELRVPFGLEGGLPHAHTGAALLDDAPAIRTVDEIFDSAIRARASDVHIEPSAGGGRVRERIDGVLRESRCLPDPLFSRTLSRIKLLAGMDITDRRLPQDGRYALERPGRCVDARISSMPTIGGERLAVRLLYSQAHIPSLEGLGMPPALIERYRALIQAPAGFVVVCGPTGSGKTTTLYASLAERDAQAQHLCTIEDPVEVRLPGVAQAQVNVRAGLSFAVALRSFLRQDPNVIMVGEMRDAETAGVAVSAALAGQLVLTTLHSNDSIRAIERLRELGVPARSLAAAVSGIASQRLVRQLCPYCKRGTVAGIAAEHFGVPAQSCVHEAVGCERCEGSGYRGRSAVFELAAIGVEARCAIEREAPAEELRRIAGDAGYQPLHLALAQLIRGGETSLTEAARVVTPEAGL